MFNNILIYNSRGGIGDSIQILPLIETLKLNLKNTKFYYLSAHNNHFNSTLIDLNSNIETLDLNLKYFGFRWWHLLIIKNIIKNKKIDRFDLIIDLQSKLRNSLILKMIPHKIFISSCLNFMLSKPKLNLVKEKKINNMILKAINSSLKFNFSMVSFNINKIDKKFFKESVRLLPDKNYVGLSITQGNIYRKKMWPIENIVNLCNALIKNNKIPVFFIEKNNKELKNKINHLIPKALFPEHNSDLSSPALVTCLGKRLDFAISIDNGVMHMLSLSQVPMIILFGPTDSDKFSPNYKNAIILDSKKLHNTKNISSISVQDVLTVARQILNF